MQRFEPDWKVAFFFYTAGIPSFLFNVMVAGGGRGEQPAAAQGQGGGCGGFKGCDRFYHSKEGWWRFLVCCCQTIGFCEPAAAGIVKFYGPANTSWMALVGIMGAAFFVWMWVHRNWASELVAKEGLVSSSRASLPKFQATGEEDPGSAPSPRTECRAYIGALSLGRAAVRLARAAEAPIAESGTGQAGGSRVQVPGGGGDTGGSCPGERGNADQRARLYRRRGPLGAHARVLFRGRPLGCSETVLGGKKRS